MSVSQVTDYRNDIILAANCRSDVETKCKDIEPGKLGAGLVHRMDAQRRGSKVFNGIFCSYRSIVLMWGSHLLLHP